MKVLITGARGMLGSALWNRLMDKYDLAGIDIVPETKLRFERYIGPKELELCNITDQKEFSTKVRVKKPDIVIHAAAYTDVDGCEKNRQKAEEVNALGTKNVALACKEYGCLLIYISTDFVFDGKKDREKPYTESDTPDPINAYGRSKLAGERYIQDILKDFIIVRSSWLFGSGGKNFVDTIVKKAKTEKELKVVNDQFGSPTYTEDLAEALINLIAQSDKFRGIYHITNSGSCSRYEFALAIKETANLDTNIIPVSSREYASVTRRPRMSVLENRYYQKEMGKKLRHWQEALKEYLHGEM